MATFTREQIDAIEPGKTRIARSFTGVAFGEADLVTSLHAKQDDIHGKLFVCGYTQFGENGWLSFSIKEGDATDARLYQIA